VAADAATPPNASIPDAGSTSPWMPTDGGASPTTPVYVEPHPVAIGKLVSTVRQLSRGLTAVGALAQASPARALLSDVDELLTVAFEAALQAAVDEPPSLDQSATLAQLPAWLDALERAADSDAMRAVDVHTDLGAGTVLEETTGGLAELRIVVREPGSGKLVVATGAVLVHDETTVPARERLTDEGWRTKKR
jgi:hypothetical protein